MARRTIIVPKDASAAAELDFDRATPEQLIEWVVSPEEWSALWEGGIVQLINGTGANVDAFEDEHISNPDQLADISERLGACEERDSTGIVRALCFLVEEARRRQTQVSFYF